MIHLNNQFFSQSNFTYFNIDITYRFDSIVLKLTMIYLYDRIYFKFYSCYLIFGKPLTIWNDFPPNTIKIYR